MIKKYLNMTKLNIFINILKESSKWVFAICAIVFAVLPETVFEMLNLSDISYELNIIFTRLLFIIILFVVCIMCLYGRENICIDRNNYRIEIEYGDLFKMDNCKKIIPFDECFTVTVGRNPPDIKPSSICGQYLEKSHIDDAQMKELIACAGLKPSATKSKYQNKDRYDSGRLVPNEDYLLMAFAKLNEIGKGELSREEIVDCLTLLWKEINKYHDGKSDVCVPILGSGITRTDDFLTQQELLNIIIWSYKLSSYKIKKPARLHIITCKGCKDFSLNNIDGVI